MNNHRNDDACLFGDCKDDDLQSVDSDDVDRVGNPDETHIADGISAHGRILVGLRYGSAGYGQTWVGYSRV